VTAPDGTTAGLEAEPSGEMTFTEHLRELRDRLVRIAGVALVGFFIGFAYREPLFVFIAAPMKEALAEYGIYSFKAIEITETIFVYLKLSIVAGIIGTLPITFYELWSFIAPGLLEREKRAVAPLVFFSTVFFLLGAWFAYEVIIPFIARYLAELTISGGDIDMDVTVKSAFGFSLKLFLAFGFAFELPLVMFFLSFLGLVDAKKYIAAWRYFVVVSFIVAALFTPPDPISQLLMAIPLNVLYWVGVGAAMFVASGEDGKRRSFKIPSKVWGMLTLSLLVVGMGIAGGTWLLGRGRSPLARIPANATLVSSVRIDVLLGPDASEARTLAVRTALGIPPEAPHAKQIIRARGPEGQELTVLVKACKDETPAIGTCAGDDLLLGDTEWSRTASDDDRSLSDEPEIRDIQTRGPAWVLERTPPKDRASLLPGLGEDTVPLTSFAAVVRLDPDDAWLELRVTPEDSGAVTGLQNRVDLWRTEAAQKADDAAQARQTARSDVEILQLMSQLLKLSDQRFALLKTAVDQPETLAAVNQDFATLKSQVNALIGDVTPDAPAAEAPGVSVIERLGTGVRGWRTAIDDDTLEIRVELASPTGIDTLLSTRI
jgi:sec-independent protein translocase protein TatC